MTGTDSFNLLSVLATPRPTEDELRHRTTSVRVNGYIETYCACGALMTSLGYDESSRLAAAYWAREHKGQGQNS